jgi:hypothetical protein
MIFSFTFGRAVLEQMGLGNKGCFLWNIRHFPHMINTLFIKAEFTVTHYWLINATPQTCKVEAARSEADTYRFAKFAPAPTCLICYEMPEHFDAKAFQKSWALPICLSNWGWGEPGHCET